MPSQTAFRGGGRRGRHRTREHYICFCSGDEPFDSLMKRAKRLSSQPFGNSDSRRYLPEVLDLVSGGRIDPLAVPTTVVDWGRAPAAVGSRFGYSIQVPFGGGTRRCVGAAFANMEMDVVLRTILRNMTIQTTDKPG